MSTETLTELNTETIEKLKDLTRINRDSAAGFKDAADVVANDKLKALFMSIAQERVEFARELNTYVDLNEGDTELTST